MIFDPFVPEAKRSWRQRPRPCISLRVTHAPLIPNSFRIRRRRPLLISKVATAEPTHVVGLSVARWAHLGQHQAGAASQAPKPQSCSYAAAASGRTLGEELGGPKREKFQGRKRRATAEKFRFGMRARFENIAGNEVGTRDVEQAGGQFSFDQYLALSSTNMPINPLSGMGARHWSACAPLLQQESFFSASLGGLLEGRSERMFGLAALWSDVTRRNSPLYPLPSTSAVHCRSLGRSVGRSSHRVLGENPRTTASSIWVSKEGGDRRIAGNARAAPPISLLLPPGCHEIKREGGRDTTKRLILPELAPSLLIRPLARSI